jgi:putative endonuclease
MRQFYVYILASKSHRLYVGVTNDLTHRLFQHRNGEVTFTSKYRINRLVHVETTADVMAAIIREKQLKAWRRSKKINLIESANPTWMDLAP